MHCGMTWISSLTEQVKDGTQTRTFHYRASVLWNSLPPKLRVNLDVMSVNEFKNAIACFVNIFSVNQLVIFFFKNIQMQAVSDTESSIIYINVFMISVFM